MPNGDHVDNRPLWQQVKDLEQTLSHYKVDNDDLRKELKKLKGENAALLTTVRLVRGDEK